MEGLTISLVNNDNTTSRKATKDSTMPKYMINECGTLQKIKNKKPLKKDLIRQLWHTDTALDPSDMERVINNDKARRAVTVYIKEIEGLTLAKMSHRLFLGQHRDLNVWVKVDV
jgi:hypothetical protein